MKFSFVLLALVAAASGHASMIRGADVPAATASSPLPSHASSPSVVAAPAPSHAAATDKKRSSSKQGQLASSDADDLAAKCISSKAKLATLEIQRSTTVANHDSMLKARQALVDSAQNQLAGAKLALSKASKHEDVISASRTDVAAMIYDLKTHHGFKDADIAYVKEHNAKPAGVKLSAQGEDLLKRLVDRWAFKRKMKALQDSETADLKKLVDKMAAGLATHQAALKDLQTQQGKEEQDVLTAVAKQKAKVEALKCGELGDVHLNTRLE